MPKMTDIDLRRAAFEEIRKRTPPSSFGQFLLVILTVILVKSENISSPSIDIAFGLIALFLGARLWLSSKKFKQRKSDINLSMVILAGALAWSFLITEIISRGTENLTVLLAGIILTAGLTAASAYSLGPVLELLFGFNTLLVTALIGSLIFYYQNGPIKWPILLYFFAYWGFTLRTGKLAFEEWRKLFLSKAEMQAVVDAFPGGVSLLRNQHYVMANAWIGEQMQLDRQKILQRPLGFTGENPNFTREVEIFAASTDDQKQFEMLLNTGKGPRLHLILFKKLSAIENEILIVTLDIEAQKKTELELDKQRQQLVSTAKMASLGEMSSGLAHEINNPLAIIISQVELLRRKMGREQALPMDVLAATLDKIETMSLRISRIVKGLSLFSQEASGDPLKVVNLLDVLEDTLSFCEARFRKANIEIKIEIPANLEIPCRPTQMSQVLLNILNNAFDAVQKTPNKWIHIKAETINGYIEIRIVDSGIGIPKELREKVMLPFFTTKAPGKGTGLGLSVAQGLVGSQNGELTLETTSPHTSFLIKMPQKASPKLTANAS